MPGLNPTQGDIEQFVAISQATEEDAVHFLSSGATLQGAIEDFYAAQTATHPSDIPIVDPELASMSQDDPAQPPRGMTLGGQAASEGLPEGWGKEKKKVGRVGEWTEGSTRSGGVTSLSDLSSRPPPSDDDQEFYTGGEKSGLAVQEPGKGGPPGARGIVDNILKQAAENGPRSAAPAPSNPFRGQGNTLGTDEPEPEPTPTPAPTSSQGILASLLGRLQSQPEEDVEPVTRHLTFWRNGFSIEDGPLKPYDAPGNKELLEAIQAGRAPPSLFGVRFDQPLQLEVAQRTGEDYTPPPKVMKPFEGGGNRLGSPAPQVAPTPGVQGILEGSTPSKPFEVDEKKPTTSIQVRLGDGTRMVARVNLDHTIADLRSFVSAARPDNRPFVLQTTFPSKELSNNDETVEAAKLQNAVVVQRFV